MVRDRSPPWVARPHREARVTFHDMDAGDPKNGDDGEGDDAHDDELEKW